MGEKRVDIKVGFLCNNNCFFCAQAHNRGKGSKTTEDIKKDLRDAQETGCSAVVFTGGEPLIRKDILELVRYAKTLGFKGIQLQTNGRLLCYKNFCRELIDAGANEFSPALHGHNAEVHDSLTKAKGSFEQTVQGIKNLREMNQFIMTNSVVTKKNYETLPQLAELLVKLGVNQFQMAFVHPIGNAYKYYDTVVPKMSLAVPYIKKAMQIGMDAGIKVMAEAIPYCMMQGYENCVSEQYIPLTEIRHFREVDFNYSESRKLGKEKFIQCKGCKYDKICEGPWKEYSEKFGNAEFQAVK